MQLTFTYLDEQFGSTPLVLPASTTSRTWEESAPLLSQAGTWQAELRVRRTSMTMRGRPFASSSRASAERRQPVAATGTYPLLPRRCTPSPTCCSPRRGGHRGRLRSNDSQPRRNRRALQRQAALLGAGILVLACGGYVYAQEQRNSGVPLDVANIRDPIAPDEQSLASGEEVSRRTVWPATASPGAAMVPPACAWSRDRPTRLHTAPGVHTDGEISTGWATASPIPPCPRGRTR